MSIKGYAHGRICADPELKTTSNGKPFTSIRLAVDRPYKSSKGEVLTDFFKFDAWGKTAETICKYCFKGSEIMIMDFSIQNNNYTDSQGKKVYAEKLTIERFEFCGAKKEKSPQNQTVTPVEQRSPQSDFEDFAIEDPEEDNDFLFGM